MALGVDRWRDMRSGSRGLGVPAIPKVKVRVAMEKEESSPQSFLRGLDVQRIHSCILDGLPWFSMIDRMHRAPSASVD